MSLVTVLNFRLNKSRHIHTILLFSLLKEFYIAQGNINSKVTIFKVNKNFFNSTYLVIYLLLIYGNIRSVCHETSHCFCQIPSSQVDSKRVSTCWESFFYSLHAGPPARLYFYFNQTKTNESWIHDPGYFHCAKLLKRISYSYLIFMPNIQWKHETNIPFWGRGK